MIFELIEYYCIYISTLLLIISPIYSFKYKLYKFCFFQTIVCITSILNHYKLYKYGRHIDVPIVWITVTYHYIQYYRTFQRNIFFLISWIIGKLLYIPSIYFNSNIIHSIMHLFFIMGNIFLCKTKLIY